MVGAADILLLGDSFAEFMGSLADDLCEGRTASNQGIGGTEATDWSDEENGLMAEAFASGGSGVSVAWLSVGGNDLLNTGCTIEASELDARLQAAIDTALAEGPAGLKILLTGYCEPTEEFDEGCPGGLSFHVGLQDALVRAADNNDEVTMIDIRGYCGGNSAEDEYSDPAFMVDPIHLNGKGYCKVLTDDAVQTFLGCEEATYDCEEVEDPELENIAWSRTGDANTWVSRSVLIIMGLVALL